MLLSPHFGQYSNIISLTGGYDPHILISQALCLVNKTLFFEYVININIKFVQIKYKGLYKRWKLLMVCIVCIVLFYSFIE